MRVSSPCPKKWADLTGDDRVRYCGDCKLNVYNLAEMSESEVEALVRKTSGRLCGRLFLRGDRTATIRDCPSSRSRGLLRTATAVGAVILLVGFGWLFRSMPTPDRSRLPDWVRFVVEMIDPEKPQPVYELVGKICPPPQPPPLPPSSPQ